MFLKIPDRDSVGQNTFAMVFDITEKMQAQDALQVAHADLARSAHVSRMGAMTASIAHEINQPLAAIVANAGAGLRWLVRTPPDLSEARENFEKIVREGRHAAEVIEGLRSIFKSKEFGTHLRRFESAHPRGACACSAYPSNARDYRAH